MKKRECFSLLMLVLTVVPALLISYNKIFTTGTDGWRIAMPESVALLREVTILFVVFFVTILVIRNWKIRLGILAMETAVVTWMHQAFLPMVVSGIYLMVVVLAGRMVRKLLDKHQIYVERRMESLMVDFTLGSMSLILLFCLMSLAGIGSIPATRAAAVVIGLAGCLVFWNDRRCDKRHAGEQETVTEKKLGSRGSASGIQSNLNKPVHWTMAIVIAFVITMVLLQAGRMNICADYDSLHYGFRSEYVLNDGGGLYENMGSINVVYTYSKGLEVLLFPISGLPSYSFFMGFQMWMVVGILIAAAEIAAMFVSRRHAMFTMALLASIPGIMNMGITAKTDIATALFQLIMAYFLLRFVMDQKTQDFAVAGNAFLLTMVLKPTSLAFSTILAGTVFIFLFVTKTFKINIKERFLLFWIPAIAMWLLIWMRTMLHTGIPVTSVFTSIWTKLGFQIKYPFMFDSIPSSGGELGLLGAVKYFLKRVYGVLLAPVGPDMAHVRIAWGTSLLLVFLVLFLVPVLARMKPLKDENKRPLLCLVCTFLTNGVMSLIMLYLLWQVDGNYFILLYCLFAILAVVVIGMFETRIMAGSVIAILVPMMVFNVGVTAVSNWGGVLGMSPVTWSHKGYYDHWGEAKEQMEHKGNVEIWDILAEDPETRVLVYGDQPEMLMFPCNAQSYVDIAGSGGNYYVSASVNGLVTFFDYAKIDYVYLCGGYLMPGTEAWRFVVDMIEAGYLTDLFYENGHALAKFTKDPAVPEDPEAVLYEFAQRYASGEQY